MSPIKFEIKTLVLAGWTHAAIGKRLGRPSSWVWEQVRELRRAGELVAERPISVAKVSILDADELSDDDFRAGKAALSAAGLA